MFPSAHGRLAIGAAVPTLLQASLIPLSIRPNRTERRLACGIVQSP